MKRKFSISQNRSIIPKWLLVAILSLNGILFSGSFSDCSFTVPFLHQTELVVDLGFFSESSLCPFSFADNQPTPGLLPYPTLCFYDFRRGKSDHSSFLQVQFNHVNQLTLTFDKPVFFYQTHLFAGDSEKWQSDLL